MTSTGPVAVLEPMSEEMQARVREICTGLGLRFPRSGDPADFAEIVADAPYIVTRGLRLPIEVLERAKAVRMIHQWGTGTDGIPVTEARRRGIIVARSPGVNAPTVADLTVGLMLATLRRIPQLHVALRGGHWETDGLWKDAFDLSSARVGLVGFGAIGRQVALRLQGFECEILYTRASGPLPDSPLRFVDLDELLPECDVVSLHMPLTAETRHLMNSERLATMKPGSVLINTSRGGLVDEAALAAALKEGPLAAAGLDVFEKEPVLPGNPILSLDNVVVLPHVGGRTRDNLTRMVAHWSDNIRAHAAGLGIDPAFLVG